MINSPRFGTCDIQKEIAYHFVHVSRSNQIELAYNYKRENVKLSRTTMSQPQSYRFETGHRVQISDRVDFIKIFVGLWWENAI